MFRVYKYRIYPTEEQKILLDKHMGAARFLYNLALETKQAAYTGNKVNLTRFDLQAQLIDLKKECEWLREVNSQSLQGALLNLDKAYSNFFKGAGGFPRFKKKLNKQSFQCPQHVSLDKKGLHLPKFKSAIKIIIHRRFTGKIKTTTITRTSSGKYFASILVDTNIPTPSKKPVNKAIGVDLGIKDFIVTSDGDKVSNPKHLRSSTARLAVLSKRLSRKDKGSKNRDKARVRVAKLHEKVTNQRRDFLHKVSDAITKQYDTVCIENLRVNNMLKNHKLARSISDCGWSMFVEFLEYKAEWMGVNVIKIGTFDPSTKLCSECGYINNDLTLKDREWRCPDCGSVLDRDINAAKNILDFGLRNAGVERSGERLELPTLVGAMKGENIISLVSDAS